MLSSTQSIVVDNVFHSTSQNRLGTAVACRATCAAKTASRFRSTTTYIGVCHDLSVQVLL
jgi:hypothetical protein